MTAINHKSAAIIKRYLKCLSLSIYLFIYIYIYIWVEKKSPSLDPKSIGNTNFPPQLSFEISEKTDPFDLGIRG